MAVKSIMKIPNFDGDRALISQLYGFNVAMALQPTLSSGSGTGPDNGLENLHNIPISRIADKNSIRLLQTSTLGFSTGKEHIFQEIELESELFENGKRIWRIVLTLSSVTFTQFIKYGGYGKTPDVEDIILNFTKISVKKY